MTEAIPGRESDRLMARQVIRSVAVSYITSAVLLLRFRVNSAWLVLGGAIVGIAARMFHGG